MSYPADAFVRVRSQTAPKGTLMYIRDIWVLSAEIEVPPATRMKSLVLTGQNAGKIYDAIAGDNGIAIAPGVTVELRVADPTLRVADGTYPTPGAVVVPPDGKPQLWVCHPNSEHDRLGFTLNGVEVEGEEHEHSPFVYFKGYEVWLTRDGKTLCDAPLFTVG